MKAISIQPLQKSIKSEIIIPGSKSYTNRSLLLAALTKKSVKIINHLVSDDTKALVDCLKRLGIKVLENDKSITVESDISSIKNRSYDLDANLSGTTIRFILALSAIIPGVKILYGKEGLNKRPIGDLVDGLRQLGAKIDYLEKKGFPPIRVSASKLNPGTLRIKGSVSSQYISAILMIAPLIGEIDIKIIGNQGSKPFIDMTIDTMKKFGVRVSNENYKRYKIEENQKYNIDKYVVEGDYSSAGYFFAIAALTKSTITVKNLNSNSVQADREFLDILEKMGNKIIYGKNKVTVVGKGVKPINVDMENCPDQVQTVAILAAFAKGVTKISGVQSLKVKETDRIQALKSELKKMGISVLTTKTTLAIHGGNPQSANIQTYGDHRMAMSFAVAGTKLKDIEIVDPDVVNKTFPTFWKKLNSVGVKTTIIDKNIVLIGMRGSGKSTVAKLLAQKLNKKYIESDELIVKKNKQTIPEMVKKYGWNYFRDKESEIVKEISTSNGIVISTGGGVVTRLQNIDILKKNGMLIHLNASLETLIKRMGNDTNRPLLTKKTTLKEETIEVLKQRKQQYKKVADEVIETDDLTPEEVVNKILLRLDG